MINIKRVAATRHWGVTKLKLCKLSCILKLRGKESHCRDALQASLSSYMTGPATLQLFLAFSPIALWVVTKWGIFAIGPVLAAPPNKLFVTPNSVLMKCQYFFENIFITIGWISMCFCCLYPHFRENFMTIITDIKSLKSGEG
jgi:hypothetical protein